jgi:N-acetylmuramoyl-L-alanine amidase
MKIENYSSPNFSKRKRSATSIKIIVIHYTGMQSERESLIRLCNPKFKVSSHFLINSNGNVYRLVEDKKVAWHAGISCWGKYENLNKNSIGIELVNKGHKFGYENFKKKQILKLIKICKEIIKKYKIKKKYIVGHSDIAPLRKIDPGEKFPWKFLASNGVGIWHDFKPEFLKKYRKIKVTNKKDKIKFLKKLEKIGYCISSKKNFSLIKITKAFQRRFRKDLINGEIDEECLLIATNLSKKL